MAWKQFGSSSKFKVPYESTIPLALCPKKLNTFFTEKHTQMFMTPFSITVPNQKHTNTNDEREAQLCDGERKGNVGLLQYT